MNMNREGPGTSLAIRFLESVLMEASSPIKMDHVDHYNGPQSTLDWAELRILGWKEISLTNGLIPFP